MAEPETQEVSSSDSSPEQAEQYVVIARRYRPQAFGDLIGQEHVAQALSNAISSSRVGHAYLFTGARGVGKTSAARILAKALNCEHGPAPVPCNECDHCERISTGEDVDVMEIDGASNRGIDEIRQLRQNAGVRPSRSQHKIYIIDEVHMLTREAFNALLKTLEEPPEHVKFIFCTTEPNKIPVTILSRCQRFDFAGIEGESIAERLDQIVRAEGVSAEPDALRLLARRASGSMRDAQSLLEQLLSFSGDQLTVADVHGMLGSAGEERLEALVGHLANRDAPGGLDELAQAIRAGVDPAQLLEQLFGYFRDCLIATVGCPAESFLYASPGRHKQVVEAGQSLGIETLMAAMQILDHALSRLRMSTQVRVLAELALVRICELEDLAELSELIARLEGKAGPVGQPASAGGRPSPRPPRAAPRVASPPPQQNPITPQPSEVRPVRAAAEEVPKPSGVEKVAIASVEDEASVAESPLVVDNPVELWSRTVDSVGGLLAGHAKRFETVELADGNRLVVRFGRQYTLNKSSCEKPEQLAKLEKALAALCGRPIRVSFELGASPAPVPQEQETARPKVVPPHQRLLEVAKHPLVERAGELFGAEPIRVDEPSEKKP